MRVGTVYTLELVSVFHSKWKIHRDARTTTSTYIYYTGSVTIQLTQQYGEVKKSIRLEELHFNPIFPVHSRCSDENSDVPMCCVLDGDRWRKGSPKLNGEHGDKELRYIIGIEKKWSEHILTHDTTKWTENAIACVRANASNTFSCLGSNTNSRPPMSKHTFHESHKNIYPRWILTIHSSQPIQLRVNLLVYVYMVEFQIFRKVIKQIRSQHTIRHLLLLISSFSICLWYAQHRNSTCEEKDLFAECSPAHDQLCVFVFCECMCVLFYFVCWIGGCMGLV